MFCSHKEVLCVFSYRGSQGHKIGVGTPQLLPRLTWCRENLAAAMVQERTGESMPGAKLVLRRVA